MACQTDDGPQCELCGGLVFGKQFGPTLIFDSNTAATALSILSILFSTRSSQGALSGLNGWNSSFGKFAVLRPAKHC
jgi:hypothetical protein